MITARHLRQILAISETGAINRAAAVLNLSQPALTASIAKLEDALGIRFFERSTRGVVPTAFGQHVLDNAGEVLGRLEKLERDLELLASGTRGRISIMAGPVLIHGVLRQVVPFFAQRYPDVHLHVTVGTAERIIDEVRRGTVDLGLATMPDRKPVAGLEMVSLRKEAFVFAARPGHPLSGRASVDRAELWAYPIATPEIPAQLRPWFDEIAETQGPARLCLEVNDYDMLIRTVRQSDAVTSAPGHLLAPYFAAGRLVPIAFSDPALLWQAFALFHRVQRVSPPFGILLDRVTQCLRQSGEAGDSAPNGS